MIVAAGDAMGMLGVTRNTCFERAAVGISVPV